MEIAWYFDFVSPFAYLQSRRMHDFPAARLKPVLFAGLLERWGQLGPAEIGPKRRFTYRHVLWQAQARGIALRFPPAHPFNPLHALRLACALDTRDAVDAIFRFIWEEGRDPNAEWDALAARLGVADPLRLIEETGAKERLRRNGEQAQAAGVFGVPTLAVGGELFWGADATDMALEYMADASRFDGAEYARLDALPAAAQRRRER